MSDKIVTAPTSNSENEILAKIFATERDLVELRETGGLKKRIAWDRVKTLFNDRSGLPPKTVTQLKYIHVSSNKISDTVGNFSMKSDSNSDLSKELYRSDFHEWLGANQARQFTLDNDPYLNLSHEQGKPSSPEKNNADNLKIETIKIQSRSSKRTSVECKQGSNAPNSKKTISSHNVHGFQHAMSERTCSAAPKRCFRRSEKLLFLQLMEKHVQTVENRKYDFAAVHNKTAAWDDITKEYNCSDEVTPRSTKQLKALWRNLKDKSRGELAVIMEAKSVGAVAWKDVFKMPQNNVMDRILQKVCSLMASVQEDLAKQVIKTLQEDPKEDGPEEKPDVVCEVPPTSSNESVNEEHVSDDPISDSLLAVFASSSQQSLNDDPVLSAALPWDALKKSESLTGENDPEKEAVDPELEASSGSAIDQSLLQQSHHFQAALINMAKSEHQQRMKVLKLEEEVLKLRKEHLEKELRQNMGSNTKKK